ncbi:ABC transporter permease [Paenibacillus sp. GSMTC-2017]|uniref:ABC transporter permease n=1 Tax=Paenibacillus sp. GSMTC-2017 TaxID=2794350 RepID=UPI0018D7898E|nr:ABC transporter permease [Paenibacillus sp. GSMTC-2017]MBH5318745.1 ABC transporter permease [Paenibacillus sp. GSMTC-2017]
MENTIQSLPHKGLRTSRRGRLLPLQAKTWIRLLTKLSGLSALLLIWFLITGLGLVTPAQWPSPTATLQTMAHMLSDGSLVLHALSSLKRVVFGFGVAFAAALPLGLLLGSSRFLRDAINPVIELFRPIPPLAFISLAILWLGIDEWSKISIIIYGAFFPLLLNITGGISQVDPVHVRAAQSLGARKSHIFYYVTLRAAIPNIMIGIRSGMGMAFICLVGSELIAANEGLGFLIQEGRYMFRTDQVLVGMITIGIIGFLINVLLTALEKALLRWK